MQRTSLAACLFLLAPAAAAQDLYLEPVASIHDPTFVTQAPGDDDRLFITNQRDAIYVVENGVLLPTPFLDVDAVTVGGLHNFGLLSMAFHPEYPTNGRFFVSYMERTMDAHIAEFRVSSTDPNVADPSTRVQILGPYTKGFHSHGWNHLWFGPDGMLYLTTGDDQQTGSSSLNVSQDLSSVNGKILRLDVDAPPPYIPSDNPFLGTPGVDERIFAYGLRQPWRSTYDPVSGLFFVGDVGAQSREEISAVPFAGLAGANFGWRCHEGTECTNFATGCPLGCADPNMIPPILDYGRAGGMCAVMCGNVYRGAAIPSLQGKFVYADYCARKFWSLRYDGTSITDVVEISSDLVAADGTPIGNSVSFGTDNAGEMYICDQGNDMVWKVLPEPPIWSYCESAPNSAGTGAIIGNGGTNSVSAADLTLNVSGAPPNAIGLFYYGAGQANFPLGNGNGCVGTGSLWYFRFTPPASADANGDSTHVIDFGVPPAGLGPGRLRPGTTWYFQYWYRDPAAGGANYNFSDGLKVTFVP